MWVDAAVPGPVMILGITEASATRKPKIPCTRSSGSTTASLSTPKTCGGKSGKFLDLLGARLGPRNEFALAQTVEGMLISKFTRNFDRAHDGRKIVIRAEIVAIDHGGILKILAGKANGTFTGGLHQGWGDCERVRWRRSKALGYF